MTCRRSVAALLAFAGMLAVGACLRFSPFDVNLDESERDQIQKNLNQLRSRAEPGPVFKVAFLADSHDRLIEFKNVTHAINAIGGIELVLHGGDFTDQGTAQEYVWALEVLKELNPPFFVTAGNHDLLANGIDVFHEMFGPDQYSFVWNGVKFVFFDTNTLELGTRHLDLAWLQRELDARDPGQLAVVITHHPPWSPPQTLIEDTDEYRRIQREASAPLVNLHGHQHAGTWAYTEGSATYLKAGTAKDSQFYIVSLDHTAVAFERCVAGESCEPVPIGPVPKLGP